MYKIDSDIIETQLIDRRNCNLWKYLRHRYKLNVFKDNEGNSRVHDIGDGYMIVLTEDNFCNEIFTHELLHIYVIDKYLDISKYLFDFCDNQQLLKLYFTNEIVYYINNMLSHILMLPIYKKLGYDMNIFVPPIDVDYIKGLPYELQGIYLDNVNMECNSVKNFICYEIMMLSESWRYNYSEHLGFLKEKNVDLFKLTENLVVNWKDTNNPEELKLLLEKFMTSLYDWIIKKRQS